MSRFFLVAFLLCSTASFAAAPEGLQQTLQQQFAQMKQQSQGRLKTEGDLQVVGDKIIYPAMKVTVADQKSYWSIPSMTLTFTSEAKDGKVPFSLDLPSEFQQVHATNGEVLRRVTLNGQAVTGDWSEKENTIARLSGKVSSVTWNDIVFNTTTSAQDIAVQAMTQFTHADKVSVLFNGQAKNFTRLPSGFSGGLMPKEASVTGQVKALPKALVAFSALAPIPGLQSNLAQMGTQIDIDQVKVTTTDGATLKGNGWFKAAKPGSPLPASGRMNLQWENLQQVLTSLQRNFSAGTGNRTDMAQSMVMLMMLQGMGKAVGQTTSYVVDLTPEGQVILNGQDVSTLFVGDKSLLKFFQPKPKNAPAVPTGTVQDEGHI